ncbi:hypothetical protein LTR16_005377 [Cryomyces antarcticus]|uniref:Shugoshin C-terminal domain-containing protein n=1 Tax=Cryomyces antarcticus TaxID=329879 RepID=A0ABR0LWU1_9PEZI|nr:hypothetical protein LTR16_005377 [Cryomyces antarcticus]
MHGERLVNAGSRAPSALSTRVRNSPIPRAEASIPGTPKGSPSLFSKKNTAHSELCSASFATHPVNEHCHSKSPESALETTVEDQHNEALERSLSPPAVSSSSSDTDSDAGLQSTRQSQTFRRPPRFNNASKSPLGILSDGDDDDDAANFLPFANLPKQTVQDSSATLRTDSKANDKQSAHRPHPSKAPLVRNQQRVESSASSASSNPQGQRQRPPGALSPHHRAELAKLSPRHRKEGSDGTPSMGSSFSDLDGARNFNNRSLNSSSDSSIYEHPLYNA